MNVTLFEPDHTGSVESEKQDSGSMPIPNHPSVISRADLIYLVNQVVDLVASHFMLPEREKLLQTAAHTDRIAYGRWKVEGVGCPITQSGLVRFSGAELFAQHYDEAIACWLSSLAYDVPDEGVLTIID